MIGNGATAADKLAEIVPSATFPLWQGCALELSTKDLYRPDLLFIDTDATPSDPNSRQTQQGIFQAFMSDLSGGSYKTGRFMVDYVVELYGPRTPADLALLTRTPKYKFPSEMSDAIKPLLSLLLHLPEKYTRGRESVISNLLSSFGYAVDGKQVVSLVADEKHSAEPDHLRTDGFELVGLSRASAPQLAREIPVSSIQNPKSQWGPAPPPAVR